MTNKFNADLIRMKWHNWKARKTGRAVRTLSKAMKDDPGFAWSWHCNIAMPIFDAANKGCVEPVMSAAKANEIAKKLMKHLFDVETSEPKTQTPKNYC